MSPRALIVDDDRAECEFLSDALGAEGFEVAHTLTGKEALEWLESNTADVVVTDLNMPGISGIDLCRQVTAGEEHPPVVVVTAFGSIDAAVGAMRSGAHDFVTKPFDVEAVAITLRRAIEHHALRREVGALRRAVGAANRFGELLGSSPMMREVYDLIDRVSDSDAAVLVTGESGTGKELVAREIHKRSRRSAGPFIAVNCAAVPEALLESELFGHTRGAFTDARSAHEGLFQRADGGTLFLDEIGDMPLGLQPKLLRALQERRVRPVGSATEYAFDARLVTATNRDIEAAVEDKRFRDDLYYRVNVVHLELPPLRARGGDVILLATAFLEQLAPRSGKQIDSLTQAAAERLLAYEWPGNVRELSNCMERAVALARGKEIDVADLPRRVQDYQASHVVVAADDPSELVPLETVEKRYILRVLSACNGNKTQAARTLGLSRKTLYRRLEAFGVPVDEQE